MSRDHKPLGLAVHYRIDPLLRFSRVIDLDLFFTLCRKRGQRIARTFKICRKKTAGFILSDGLNQPLNSLLSLRRKLGVLAVVDLFSVANKKDGLFLSNRVYNENTKEKKKT